jgi:hypothetical protein
MSNSTASGWRRNAASGQMSTPKAVLGSRRCKSSCAHASHLTARARRSFIRFDFHPLFDSGQEFTQPTVLAHCMAKLRRRRHRPLRRDGPAQCRRQSSSAEGRDHEAPIEIEWYWRRKQKRFTRLRTQAKNSSPENRRHRMGARFRRNRRTAAEQPCERAGIRTARHQSMKMTMRYAPLSPAFLSAEVGLLDRGVAVKVTGAPPPSPGPEMDPPPSPAGTKRQRARKGQTDVIGKRRRSEVPGFVREIGSSGWIRTSNPPVNRSGRKKR